MAEVTLPGGKKVPKGVAIAVAVGGSIVAYMIYKKHSSAAASSSAATTGQVTDPGTGTSYPANATDPVTGETYAQEIGQYGSVSAADSAVAQTQQSYLYNQGDLYGTGYAAAQYSTGTYGAPTTTSGSVYTSNSAWAQAAQAGLQDIGYTGTDVATALGDYLTGTPVTADQAAIIRAAIANYGNPPTGSYQIIAQPSGNNGGTPPPATVAVPSVVGLEAFQAGPILQSVGLKVTLSGPSFQTGGPLVRIITAQNPAANATVSKGSTVTLTYKVQQNQLAPKVK